jgi:hypothetical protein
MGGSQAVSERLTKIAAVAAFTTLAFKMLFSSFV